jgi:hypothetical protein
MSAARIICPHCNASFKGWLPLQSGVIYDTAERGVGVCEECMEMYWIQRLKTWKMTPEEEEEEEAYARTNPEWPKIKLRAQLYKKMQTN